MDVFHRDLKPVEASCLGDLYLRTKLFGKVLKDDAIAGRKEC